MGHGSKSSELCKPSAFGRSASIVAAANAEQRLSQSQHRLKRENKWHNTHVGNDYIGIRDGGRLTSGNIVNATSTQRQQLVCYKS